MKKIYTLISVSSLILLAAACAKEIDNPVREEIPGENGGTMTVTLSVPESPETKTALGGKEGNSYPVLWDENDVITLNGTAASSFTLGAGSITATATFKLASLTAPYNFLYCGVPGQGNQVTFPSTQHYEADGFDPAAMPMYASLASRSDNVTFRHVAALLKFSFTGDKKLSSVTLTAAEAEKSLSGNFTIGATAGILNGSLTPASGGASLIYSFGGNKQLSDDPFVFYIAIPAGTYEGGIILDVVDNSSGHMTVKVLDSNATKTIDAGVVREFDNVVYSPDKVTNLKQINSVATFQEFVAAVAGGNKTLNARLVQSSTTLDLSSIAGSFEPIEDYKGIFDGNGKTISGLTKPMFADLMGVVKNLTLNSTIAATADDDNNWGIFAKRVIPSTEIDDIAGLQNCTAKGSITWTPASAIEGENVNCQIGGLVGNNKGGSISNCANYATVTFADNGGVNDCQPSIGGVVGRTQKGGDLKTQGDIANCANHGTVQSSADFGQGVYIGGVLGYQVESAESMRGCVNHGLVKVTSDFSTIGPLHIGGVAGIARGSVEECTNASDGTVTTEPASVGTYLCQGGVIGRINNTSATYSGLSNAGNINVAAAGASSGAYIGGTVGRFDEGAFIESCTNTGGIISYTGEGATGEVSIGGIVGVTLHSVTSCTNATAINAGGSYPVNASSKYFSVGGVVGYNKGDWELIDNTNTAAITISGTIDGFMALGGICGYTNGPIQGGGNSGTVSFTGSSTNQNVPVGGVVGRIANGFSGDIVTGATNSGAVVINTSTQSGKVFYVGGVAGHHQSGNLNATNNGTVTVTELSCTQLFLGGLTGLNAGAITAGSANQADGDISVAGLTTSNVMCVGGVTGQNDAEVSANNAGDVVLTSGSTTSYDMFVGGVVGRGKANVTSSSNSGLVSNACPQTKSNQYIEIGGIVGFGTSTCTISDCENSGEVTNTANSKGYIYVGGIAGEVGNDLTSCTNTGAVSNSGAATTVLCLGGTAGVVDAITLDDCQNTGAISITSESGRMLVGGMVGKVVGTAASEFDGCENDGNITISDESTKSDQDHIVVGGIAGRGDAQVLYSSCTNKGLIRVDMYGNTNRAGIRAGGIFGDNAGKDNDCTGCVNDNDIELYYQVDATPLMLYAVGGVAGMISAPDGDGQDGSEINACTNNGYLYVISNRAVMGGIVGQMVGGRIIDSENTNQVRYRYNKSVNTFTVVGGIAGDVWDQAGEITGCTNSGAVTLKSLTGSSERSNYAGGIAGWIEDDTSCVVSGCENTGDVTCNTCADSDKCAAMAGGIIGYKESASKDSDNVNRGNVTAIAVKSRSSVAGGVVGALHHGTLQGCYNYGTIEAGEKSSSDRYKDVISTYSNSRAGSIAGWYKAEDGAPYLACDGTITKCYVGGAVRSRTSSGNLITITSSNYGGYIVGIGDDPTDCYFAE